MRSAVWIAFGYVAVTIGGIRIIMVTRIVNRLLSAGIFLPWNGQALQVFILLLFNFQI
ncbi:hypothetical protein DI53_0539 [Sphingobacterium deserti]|uniref:Uncharacterized protein n=1 Tax=Sphingobacterium deserti TaxID=1229276 RepID=A0A0B8T3L7_9SPHI|nr:hypothetical protein DI53_0539 [Sphingobacterium deserti]